MAGIQKENVDSGIKPANQTYGSLISGLNFKNAECITN